MKEKVEEIFAFVVTDKDGTEGIPAFSDPFTRLMMPMVGADMNRVYSLLPIARRMFPEPGKFKILHFANGVDITQSIMDNG